MYSSAPKRVGFTIIFNGLHHLTHNAYAERLARLLDYWVIVDGLALPNGSTAWCKNVSDHWHNHGSSNDGTTEYLARLAAMHENVFFIPAQSRPWRSKDIMVNAAMTELNEHVVKNGVFPVYLWQIDADEQWTAKDMGGAEKALAQSRGDTGMFLCNYWVGKARDGRAIRAVGEWGEGHKLNYRRLWRWEGQMFSTHEPPELVDGNGKEVLLPQRFEHYAYFFDKDVRFKEEYYGDDGLYERWRKLQQTTEFPRPVSDLITGFWSVTKTYLIV